MQWIRSGRIFPDEKGTEISVACAVVNERRQGTERAPALRPLFVSEPSQQRGLILHVQNVVALELIRSQPGG
jgi:hypothetical protein